MRTSMTCIVYQIVTITSSHNTSTTETGYVWILATTRCAVTLDVLYYRLPVVLYHTIVQQYRKFNLHSEKWKWSEVPLLYRAISHNQINSRRTRRKFLFSYNVLVLNSWKNTEVRQIWLNSKRTLLKYNIYTIPWTNGIHICT